MTPTVPAAHEDAALPRKLARLAATGYLSFRLGAEEYGVDILKVQEIRGYEPPTRIAGAPPFVKGVISLRGVIVPIVDLRLRFGLPDPSYDGATVVVILNVANRVVGAVVDSVSDVIEFAAEQVREAPEFSGAVVDASCIDAIATLEHEGRQRMLILTDIEALMASPETGLVDLRLSTH